VKKLIFTLFLISSSYALAESHLPECQGDDVSIYNNCFASVIYENGDQYVGEFKDGKRHGQGTSTTDEWIYVGEHKDDKRHGQGTFTGRLGDEYVGEWKDDLPNGQGTYNLEDGTIEKGIFKDGKLLVAESDEETAEKLNLKLLQIEKKLDECIVTQDLYLCSETALLHTSEILYNQNFMSIIDSGQCSVIGSANECSVTLARITPKLLEVTNILNQYQY